MSGSADHQDQSIPLWCGQWHSRPALAEYLQVTERTINRRVLTGDVERKDALEGRALFRPVQTEWLRHCLDKLRHVEDVEDVEDVEASTSVSKSTDEPHKTIASTSSTSASTLGGSTGLDMLRHELEMSKQSNQQLTKQLQVREVELAKSQTALVHVERENAELKMEVSRLRMLVEGYVRASSQRVGVYARFKRWLSRVLDI